MSNVVLANDIQKKYSGDLNSELLWYSDHRDLFARWMVHYSDVSPIQMFPTLSKIYSQLSKCSTARGAISGLSLGGPTLFVVSAWRIRSCINSAYLKKGLTNVKVILRWKVFRPALACCS